MRSRGRLPPAPNDRQAPPPSACPASVSQLASTAIGRWIRGMAIFGSIEAVRAQAPVTPTFATAWSYIEELLRPGSAAAARISSLRAGESKKVELTGGAFAIEQVYETKARSEGFFESHRKYIDVQVIVAGEEIMEVLDLAHAKVRDPYLEERDLIAYQDAASASALRLRGGEAAVFFPVDVHMPSLRSGAKSELVRKAVLKLPVQA